LILGDSEGVLDGSVEGEVLGESLGESLGLLDNTTLGSKLGYVLG